jgi:hypothetical protein
MPPMAIAPPRAASCGECAWVVICDRKGVPVGYDLAGPKIGQERESAFRLASAHPHSLLFADGGFWGAEYRNTMELIDIQLITPNKHTSSDSARAARSPRPAFA